MNHLTATPRIALLSIALACAGMAHAQNTMNAAEYGAAKDRIQADYKVAKAACDRLTGNAEDICEAEAKGKEKVALAELQHRRSGKADDARKLTMAKANAAYEVAKERCDELKGNEKDVCMKDAKATETRMKADAKAGEKTAEARRDAAEDKRDAEYKAAVERCDSMSGAAKSECQNSARARFGKS